jgi:hypothetical protein
VSADALEEEVCSKLFDTLGNPAAFERAVKKAIPNCDALLKQKAKLESDLSKTAQAIERILSLVVKGAVSEEDSIQQLNKQRDRKARVSEELEKVNDELAAVSELKGYSIVKQEEDGAIYVFTDDPAYEAPKGWQTGGPGANDLSNWLSMSRKDERDLIQSAFGTPLPGGKTAGVYVLPVGQGKFGPKSFSYRIEAGLIQASGRVTQRSRRLPGTVPPLRRCRARTYPPGL